MTPALTFGDLGAAGCIAHTALAAYRLSTATAGDTGDLILCSSDDPLRGAIHLLPATTSADATRR